MIASENPKIRKTFDIFESPLIGTNLIEASAGTGKTYTLEGVVVRLLLQTGLTLDQILMVTYTRNAVMELKNRIRKKLISVKEALSGRNTADPFTRLLISEIQEDPASLERTKAALLDFDRAAIFTIHGFCQRVLQEQAFETGSVFAADVLIDPSQIIKEAANDFWRKNIYSAPVEFVAYALKKLSGPQTFAKLYKRYAHPDLDIIPRIDRFQFQWLEPYRAGYERIKESWPVCREEVCELMKSPGLDGRTYGSLKPVATETGRTKRDYKIRALTRAMDDFIASDGKGFPVFDHFGLFTSSRLHHTGKSNVPAHDFFSCCDRLAELSQALLDEMEQAVLCLKTEFFPFADQVLTSKKKEANRIGFDDMLVKVRDALIGAEGTSLVNALREKYKAVLLDEFQDTDTVQYEIFSRTFKSPEHLLVMIGDPKQAIYGFRGADIFSYIKAVDETDAVFTLDKNWRSTPELVRAVNAIFSNPAVPFIFKKITFTGVEAGLAGDNKDRPVPAMTIWHLSSDDPEWSGKPIPSSRAVEEISAAVAGEIQKITSGSPSDIRLEDIAILVRTNRQAVIIKKSLEREHIPSVLYDSGNIFDTREALELERILSGLAEPLEWRIKSALATRMLGGRGEDFDDGRPDPKWEGRLSKMRQYALDWKTIGFTRMFRRIMAEEKIKERLMRLPDGERRLTNLLHLSEILHQVETEEKPGTQGLVKWLNRKRNDDWMESEDHLLRLEKDSGAVKIVTIHKSKGLEYPVVFCPFAWEGALIAEQSAFQFHDPDMDNRRILDIGSNNPVNRSLAQTELLAENLRLYYVALTRAKKKCYLAWGRIRDAETSAPAYLFHFREEPRNPSEFKPVDALKAVMALKTEADILSDLHYLAGKSAGAIEVAPLPKWDIQFTKEAEPANPGMTARAFTGFIDKSWKVTSYSALAANREENFESPDRDALEGDLPVMEDLVESHMADYSDVIHFPKGVRAGLFFHELLENLDFSNSDQAYRANMIETRLQSYGFDRNWCPAVLNMIGFLLETSIGSIENDNFNLSEIRQRDRIDEMEFYYPIQKLTPKRLEEIFSSHLIPGAVFGHAVSHERFTFSPVQGFMRGFIDLIFKRGEKYYIVDWKSNFLGRGLADYLKNSIEKAMLLHQYFVQYHIYALALHLYLTTRLKGYDYGKNFGGIYYLFLRGFGPNRESGSGIFYDRPSEKRIHMLRDNLIR